MTIHTPFNIDTLDEFTRAYMECSLWSSSYTSPAGECNFDDTHDITDIAPETRDIMIADCKRFQEENNAILSTAYADKWDEDSTGKEYKKESYSPSQAGHDFWLTRCGHGAGFWDRGLGSIGDDLSKLVGWKTDYPQVDLYLGDDGRIYA